MERLRDEVPVPQDFVQAPQAENAETVQCTAHGLVLHGCVSAECGQTLPPNRGCTKVRLRACEPPPHDLVHVDQAVQALMTQSFGHITFMAHVRYSVRYGHALPPNCGCAVWMRSRV